MEILQCLRSSFLGKDSEIDIYVVGDVLGSALGIPYIRE
jgi:hypothetical protein